MKRDLADLIVARKEDIVERFVEYARRAGASASLPNKEVIDSLRDFIDELAADLKAAHAGDTAPRHPSASAMHHGRQRFGLGYDIGAVVREYGALREVLYDVIEDSDEHVSHRETRVLFRRISDATADATATYSADHAEQLRRKTSEHIAFLAHELRNPLGSAMFALALLRDRGDMKPVRAADLVERSLKKVSHLIDDSLVTISLKDVRYGERAEIDVAELLREIAEESEADAETKSIRIQLEAAGKVRGERKALRSAISNLVRNAVKFTHHGGAIRIRSRAEADRVFIEVEDACGGLPPGQLEKLFDPFVQVGKDRSGFGLGLAIAKQATEAHDGELRVHDLPGRGCVFVLDLPA